MKKKKKTDFMNSDTVNKIDNSKLVDTSMGIREFINSYTIAENESTKVTEVSQIGEESSLVNRSEDSNKINKIDSLEITNTSNSMEQSIDNDTTNNTNFLEIVGATDVEKQNINNENKIESSNEIVSTDEANQLSNSSSVNEFDTKKVDTTDVVEKKNNITNEIESPDKTNDSINEEIERKVKAVVNEQLENLNVVYLKKDFIVFENVTKEYSFGTTPTVALNNVSFKINEGELVIFLGHSGAGKTTALNLLGGMDTVTSGTVTVDGRDITKYDYEDLTEYRRKDIGFVFQFYNLIQNLSAKENIELSTEISIDKLPATKCLEEVGLLELADKFPSQLSGGEQQRVAIARALAKKPKILLCDEPTGALDYKTGRQVLKLIQDTCKKNKITTVIITHNQDIVPMADKIIHFNSGKILKCECNPSPLDIEEFEW